MPPQLGDFISATVYDNMLHSWNHHSVAPEMKAIYLLDAGGKERKNVSNSFEVRIKLF